MTLTSVSAGILAIYSQMFVFKLCFTKERSETSSVKPVDWSTEILLTKGSETSSVKPVDWRTERPWTTSSETPSVEAVLHVWRVLARMTMKVIVKYSPHWTIGKFKGRGMFARRTSWGLTDWRSHCLNVSDDQVGRGTPVLRRVVHPVCRNLVTDVKNYFGSGTGSLVAALKRFRKTRWVAIIQSIRKVGFDGKRTFLTTPTHDNEWMFFQGNFRISSINLNPPSQLLLQ